VPPLDGEVADELRVRRLRHAVAREHPVAAQTREARHDEERPAAALGDHRYGGVRELGDRAHVQRVHPVERSEVDRAGGVEGGARVRDDGVEASPAVERGIDDDLRRSGRGQVEREAMDVGPALAQGGGDVLGIRGRQPGDHDARTCRRERLRCRTADAGRPARDDRDLAGAREEACRVERRARVVVELGHPRSLSHPSHLPTAYGWRTPADHRDR
jgi:hypothetical protein